MNQFRLLKPEEAARRAKAKVAAFKHEKELEEARAKRKPPANPAVEPANAKTLPKDKDGLNMHLKISARNGHVEEAERLLNAGADVDGNEDFTPLMWAAMYAQGEVVKLLVDRGADVNAKDEKGRTALILASLDGHAGIARFLIKRGADVNAQDKRGRTALMCAAIKGNENTASQLVNKKADVNIKDNDGKTALDLADSEDGLGVSTLIVKYGAKKGEELP